MSTEKKRRGRKPGPNSPKDYFREREEKAVKQYLIFGRESKLVAVLVRVFEEHTEDPSLNIAITLTNLVDNLRRQQEKIKEKLAEQLEAESKEIKWEEKLWENAYSWHLSPKYVALDDVIDEDLFRVLEIENEADFLFSLEKREILNKSLLATLQHIETERNDLFRNIIEPALRHLTTGVMSMPKFQKIIGIPLDVLEEDAYYHLIFQLDKFRIGMTNKKGQLVKAYSYYGTIVKNYILGTKIQLDKVINEQGGMVSIDSVAHLGDANDSATEEFEDLRKSIVDEIDKIMLQKRMNKNDITVGNSLKYMLNNWHKIEFQTKNEFVRLLCQYCQLDPPVVGRSLKKFKTAIYDKFLSRKTKVKNKTS